MNLVDPSDKVKTLSIESIEDTVLVVESKKVYKDDFGRFNAIGVLNNKKEKGSKVDLLDILFSCSRAAGLLFIDLKNNRDPQNNVVTMKQWETLTVGQLRSKYSQLKELMDKHLIIKVEPIDDHISKPPRFTYMINPYIIIPRKNNDTKNLWKLLGGAYAI